MKHLFVIACLGLCGFASADVTVPRLNTVHHFQPSDYPVLGNFELSPLVQGADGQLWGVSAYGGVNSTGFVYKVSPLTGALTRVHDFGFSDGVHPRGRLFAAADGWLYGTTESGGVNQSDWCYAGKFYNGSGCGTLFRVAPDGRFEKLHDFYTEADGYQTSPSTGVVQGADGAFYGMAVRAFPEATTALFRYAPGTGMAVARLFAVDGSEGDLAYAGLSLARDGSLIGTTSSKGGGCGTVFRRTPAGAFQTLHVFRGAPAGGSGDGCVPWSALAEGADGVFYGTTNYGGYQAQNCRAGGCGIVYRVSTGGDFAVLHRFTATAADGEYPSKSGVVIQPDGSLYGTTGGNPYGEGFGFVPLCQLGGSSAFSCGTVWRIAPGGGFSTVAVFGDSNGAWGLFPQATLLRGQDGNLYGTAFGGGGWGYGTVWRLVLDPATPLVAIDGFTPPGGPPGTAVLLRGAGFSGATQVTLGNGSIAEPIPFSVIDDATISTQVPADARSSAFGVTAPHGTTYSPASFILRPVVDSITPTSGRPGSYVTVLGANFDALTSIRFGGVPATRYTYVTNDNTAINVQVPRRAKTGPVVVGNVGGDGVGPTFTVKRFGLPQDGAAAPAARPTLRCARTPAASRQACGAPQPIAAR